MKSNADEMNYESDVGFREALKEFRSSARVAAERPESFWAGQRRCVLGRVGERRRGISIRLVPAWGVAATLAILFVLFMLDRPQALPAPDFAVGYDQDLLSDVERLTEADVPSAMDPAMLLADEIRAGLESGSFAGQGKTTLPMSGQRSRAAYSDRHVTN